MRVESINAIVSETAGQGLWLESSEEHLPASIAGVLRLRAMSRPLCVNLRGASLRMTGLLGASTKMRFGVQMA
jgi:hypothetical protein